MTDMMAAGRAEIQSGRSITRVLVGTGYGSRVWNALVENEEMPAALAAIFYYYAEKIIKRRGVVIIASTSSIARNRFYSHFPRNVFRCTLQRI